MKKILKLPKGFLGARMMVLLLGLQPLLGWTKPKVVATTTFIADMAQVLAGPDAEVISLMPLGGDPHVYDPVPGDAKLVAESDLILRNGLTLEGWLNEMIENAGNSAPLITVTNGISPISSADHPDASDPHAWMDLQHAQIYVHNIRDALISLDPQNSENYQARHDAYIAEIKALDKYIQEQIVLIPPVNRVLVTSHDAFRYYGNRYGLRVESILGTSTDAEARVEDFRNLVAVLREYKVPAVFLESTINPKILQQLAADEGVKVGGKLFADSLGDEESGAATFLDMLRHNTDQIVAGLRQQAAIQTEEQSLSFLWAILALFALAFGVVAFRLRDRNVGSLSPDESEIRVEGLSVSYDRKTALSNIYLEIKSGHVYGLIGGNGSGKSTLLKSILGLIPSDAGTISIGGREIDAIRKHISYIPQKEEIDWSFPATVLDIVLMGRYPHVGVFDRLAASDRSKALNALEMLGIMDLKDKQIGELSGGQQQRTFIARALCQEAEIYMFDEPFVGVDITTETRIMEIVKGLAAAGKLVIIIHHDLAKVRDYFDRLIMINQRVIAAGDTLDVFTDENIQKTYGGRLTILQKTENYR